MLTGGSVDYRLGDESLARLIKRLMGNGGKGEEGEGFVSAVALRSTPPLMVSFCCRLEWIVSALKMTTEVVVVVAVVAVD